MPFHFLAYSIAKGFRHAILPKSRYSPDHRIEISSRYVSPEQTKPLADLFIASAVALRTVHLRRNGSPRAPYIAIDFFGQVVHTRRQRRKAYSDGSLHI